MRAQPLRVWARLVIAGTVLCWGAWSRMDGSQREETVRVRTDDDCEPTSWQEAYAFSQEPSPERVAWAVGVLEGKLDRWDSQCKDAVKMILETIGEHRIKAGQSYLLRFLRVDLTLPRAEPLARTAARALGRMGGDEVFRALAETATTPSGGLRASTALAFGALEDHRSVPILERLAVDLDAEVREAAFSSLAHYCSPTSRSTALEALRDLHERARNSAAWWLAQCGQAEDGSQLAVLMDDRESLVRGNALKGLIRLRSRDGCPKVAKLIADESLTVQALARDYKTVCKAP